MDPRLRPLNEQDFDLAGIDIVVNTHLHGDHCGGNPFAGKPIYVQRQELEDARSEDDYTIREWLEAPGVRYVPVDELELLPGVRLVPAPGHTRGTQVVVVETGERPIVVGGDVAVWFGELEEPDTEGQLLVLGLDPELVWLAHGHEPWRPRTDEGITLALRPVDPHVAEGRAGLHLDYVLLGSRPFGLFESLCTLPNFVCRSRYAATPPRTPTSTAPNAVCATVCGSPPCRRRSRPPARPVNTGVRRCVC